MSKTEEAQMHQDLKQALEAVRLFERRTAKLMAQHAEPIAILSMACRLPGSVDDPESYWELLEQGRDSVCDFPERWQGMDLYDPDPGAIGKTYARQGGFLDRIDGFDAQFFGIAPREAQAMDPQQRVVLETAWEALERAGIEPSTLRESSTGVYLGAIASEYASLNQQGLQALDGYQLTSNMMSVASGRVAYVLGLHGPALTVDTACSSSLVALHLACNALRRRECDMALTGGVGLIVTPAVFVEFSRLRGLAPDGRCKSFSARADGAGWAEGCGMLVLKRVTDAQRDGDRILALVRSSAINQDGRSQGLTAPNGPAQQRVIREALKAGKLSAHDIDAVEAHGTGTALGDPVEAGALLEVFGPERDPQRPLYLGSSKSNLGHTAAAAGVVGVIKMVLALHHERLPKTLHVAEPTPHIEWAGSGLALLAEAREWPRSSRVRRAGISAFGISGTNAHVIIEEPPEAAAAETSTSEVSSWLWSEPALDGAAVELPWVVSGSDEASLRAQAARLSRWLMRHPDARLADVVHTLALHRTHFDARAAFFARSREDATEALDALVEGRDRAGTVRGLKRPGGKVVFVFPGQGSQWFAMGRELLSENAVFAEAVQAVDAALLPWTGWSVTALLRGETSQSLPPWERVDAVQPALFAVGMGLAAVWRSLGIEPAAVVGHSQGEVTAAVVSGALSLEDGAKVVALRSQAVRKRCGDGAMVLIERPPAEVEAVIAKYGTELSIAAVNTASSTIVSGAVAAVDALLAELQSQALFARKINVDYASHSAQMDELLPALREQLASIQPRAGQVPLYSTVEARVLSGAELDAEYWCKNLRQTVRFDRALSQLLAAGHGVFVELSAHPVLTLTLSGACEGHGAVVVGSLQRDKGGMAQLQRVLAELHVQGQRLDFRRLLEPVGGHLIDLPTYAFQRSRYWVESDALRKDANTLGLATVKHPLLGALVSLADSDGYVLSGLLSLAEQPWLKDHAVHGTVLMPGTGLLELALHAARTVGLASVAELTLEQPLVMSVDSALQLQLTVGAPDAQEHRPVAIFSRAGDAEWQRHAVGTLAAENAESAAPDAGFEELQAWPVPEAEAIDVTGLYATLHAQGLQYGPTFQGLVELCKLDQTAYARVQLPESARPAAAHYGVHPALLDAALHSMVALGVAEGIELPFAWSDVQLYASGARELRVRAEVGASESGQRTVTFWIADGLGAPVARIAGLHVRPLRLEQLQAATRRAVEHLYRLDFQAAALPAADGAEQLVLGGDGQLAQQLGAAWSPDLESYLLQLGEAEPAARIVLDARGGGAGSAEEIWQGAQAVSCATLTLLQRALSEPKLSTTELLWVTTSAVDGGDGELRDLVHAPLWGMLRAVRNEHPERKLRLLDLGSEPVDPQLLEQALSATREPELALRGQQARAPRLVRVYSDEQGSLPELTGTVLVTGGTGELGAALAQHLVAAHGVKQLVLTSRQGLAAPGAEQLVQQLRAAGAEQVEVRACDVTERASLTALLDDLGAALCAVFHLSGVLEDGVLQTQTVERLERVFAPKVGGALLLDELTRERALQAFVLYSSASGTLGGVGQSNYAAANALLDALAVQRRQQGLPGQSLAWGLWQPSGTGLTGALTDADLGRLARSGIAPLTAAQGVQLLDAALRSDRAHVATIRLELSMLQRAAEQGVKVPALMRSLVRPGLRRASAAAAAQASALRERLSTLAESERLQALVELVCGEVATVLGLAHGQAVDPDKELAKLGLDSLMAVEVRNRLAALAGTTLPATLAFDYPTPRAIAQLLLKQAFGELAVSRGHVRKSQLRAGREEPIAIISMACRLPGGIDTPERYWELLERGGDAIEPFPARWSGLDVYDPNPDAPGKTYVREGGFVREVEWFDADFFGNSAREVKWMDPQQRLVLETAWEALERAGIRPSSLNESATGVYMGCLGSDYAAAQATSYEAMDGYFTTGVAGSVLSGRLSYTLGLQGPSMTVDTACSSSLVSLHLACNALRQGECDLALVGGVTVMTTPSIFIEFSRLRGLAPDGRCKSFSSAADGAGWAEGCGMLVVKRLSDARREGDRVLALVRGSAVNQDGRSQGLTAPNGPAQVRVIQDALRAGKLSARDIDAIEAHGTGTALGDPIEAGALAEVFGKEREAEHPLYLGSSKSNLGHTQAAAGIAGVIKVVLALQNELMPKTLHADKPTPHIAWESSGLSLLREPRAWKRNGRPRRAGVSSFGVSGTNAHVVIEEAPVAVELPRAAEVVATEHGLTPAAESGKLPEGWSLLVSGRDHSALRAQADRLSSWLGQHPDARLSDVVHTLALHRTHFDVRAAVAADTLEQALEGLHALRDGQHHAALVQGQSKPGGKVVFVFPGQGSQWFAMGRELLTQNAVFAEAVQAADAALTPWSGWSVLALLRGEASESLPPWERVDAVQPALFAMSVGLAAVWRSLGLKPAAVVGHSQGEVSAAVVSGALSLEDGAKVVALRSQAVRKRCGDGAMLLIERPFDEVQQLIANYGATLSIAAVNTESSTIVSGDAAAVDALLEALQSQSLFARKINVDYASHSAQMDELLPALRAELADIQPRAGQVPLYSTVEGRVLSGEELNAEYWCRNLRETVRLDLALSQLMAAGHGVFVEVSAHPVLTLTLSGACEEKGAIVAGSLQRERGGMSQLRRALAELHVQGHGLDWALLLAPVAGRVLQLPTYAFQRQRHWFDSSTGWKDARALGLSSAEHPLLGAMTSLADSDGYVFSSRLTSAEHAWLKDHAVQGTVLVPGTGMVELALHAARSAGLSGVHELTLEQPLVLPDGVAVQLQLSIGALNEAGQRSVSIFSRVEGADWLRNASGTLAVSDQDALESREFEELRAWQLDGTERVELAGLYERLHAGGLQYGPGFQGLVELHRAGNIAYSRVKLADNLRGSAGQFGIHPALMDAALHGLLALGTDSGLGAICLPFAWSEVQLLAAGATELRVRTEITTFDGETPESAQQVSVSLHLADASGEPVAHVKGLRVRPVKAQQFQLTQQPRAIDHLYRIDFQPVVLPEVEEALEQAVLGGDGRLSALLGSQSYADVEQLLAAAPRRVIVDLTSVAGDQGRESAVRSETTRVLELLQQLLAAEALRESEFVWLTAAAVSSGADWGVRSLEHAPVWGLLRTARNEHLDRALRLLDIGESLPEAALLQQALGATKEPELALRSGVALAARLATVAPDAAVAGPWRVAVKESGRLDALEIVAAEEATTPLGPTEVRVSVRASGLNFRDVVTALGMVWDGLLGVECAGVVLEVGSEVRNVRVGER
ncbi:MAG TPA: SDR family NAD(P)-dependent oxidoreductase, partial [Polyangiales bacterium]|nr:SDR family NAD(P)-dependent oxidoreductase [Polyangiales bacterium]